MPGISGPSAVCGSRKLVADRARLAKLWLVFEDDVTKLVSGVGIAGASCTSGVGM